MNTFGRKFRIHILGESHGPCVGIVIDGCPSGIALAVSDFSQDIQRRKSGALGTTPRLEEDMPNIVTGVFNGHTTGSPITILFDNNHTQSQDYDAIKSVPRPGHADFVLQHKYKGYNDYRGGGHSSGRLTLCLVAAGVLAKKIIQPISICATLIEAGGSTDIDKAIAAAVKDQDSIGGIVACTAQNMPIGLGEPFFDSLESLISHLVFAIPAIKGIAFGAGFAAASMKGSTHNDAIIDAKGTTASNHAGGINGGISNGNDLYFQVVVKPTSSTPKEQTTWHQDTHTVAPFTVKGRHDLCVALRVPVVLEAVTAIALAECTLLLR